jgi:hypoxanthine phosphoribosyltransferase
MKMKLSKEILLQQKEIEMRIAELAALINYDFEAKDTTILAVLNGSYIFAADITRRLTIPYSLDFVGVKSTTGNKTGNVKKVIFFGSDDFTGRHVLLLDDILDSGRTISCLKKEVSDRGAESITVCVLVEKEKGVRDKPELDYRGFMVSDKWLVGYGMDYNGLYRGLPYIGYVE